MLIVDTPFPPYAPKEYVYGGMPAVGEFDELWSDEPETGLGDDAKVVKESPEDYPSFVWLVDGHQSRSDGKASSLVRTRNGKVRDLTWTQKDNERHRGGDLPAKMLFHPSSGGELTEAGFYKKGLMHRISDYAFISTWENLGKLKEFRLYDHLLAEDEFFSVHADAIKYNVPLWVALCKAVYSLDFNALGDSVEDFGLLSHMPFEWVAKIIGLAPEDERYIRFIFPVLQYEKDELKL